METFVPPVEPSVGGATLDEAPKVLTAPFGDNHLQRTGDGLNARREMWRLAWKKLSIADADTIVAFFRARKGYEKFEWTPPDAAAPLRFICPRWTRPKQGATADGLGHDEVTAEFEQVFDL